MSDGIRVVYSARQDTLTKGTVTLAEGFTGKPYLAIPWPTDAPAPWNDPGCALREWTAKRPNGKPVRLRITGIPVWNGGSAWHVATAQAEGDRSNWALTNLTDLTPADEPKRCGHIQAEIRGPFGGDQYIKCLNCGTILSDRREGERRRRERRADDTPFIYGGRRRDSRRQNPDRRGDR